MSFLSLFFLIPFPTSLQLSFSLWVLSLPFPCAEPYPLLTSEVKKSPFSCACVFRFFTFSLYVSFFKPLVQLIHLKDPKQAEDWHKGGSRIVTVKGSKGVDRERGDMLPSSSSDLPLAQLTLSSVTLPFVLPTQPFVLQCYEEVGKVELHHFVSNNVA